MKKIVAALAVSAALSSPAMAQSNPLAMGGLAANGAAIAAGITFLVIIGIGANADGSNTAPITTTRN